jgi:flagellar protein FliL
MASQEPVQEKPPLNIKKILGIIFVVVNFLVVGGGAFATYAATIGYVPKVVSEKELNDSYEKLRAELQAEPIMYTMETFNTNLVGLPRQFIRLEVNVEMYSQEGYEELFQQDSQARDAVMRILNGKKLEDLEPVQGKLRLKNEISAMLNDILHRGVVKNVYFTKFQVQ